MSSLLTNASAQTALQTLRNVQGNLQETQDRISTGLKVRSPKDNPAFFLVAQTVRGDLTVLEGLRDNLTIGVNAAKTAGSGIDGITSFINTIQKSLTSAEGGAALNEIQFAINEVVGQIEGQVEGTNFNGVNLLKGVNTTTVTTTVIREAGQFKLSTFTLQAQNLDSLELAGDATGVVWTGSSQQQFDAVYRAFNPGLGFRLDSNGDGTVDLSNGGTDDLGVGAGGNSFTFYGSDEDVAFLASIGITATNSGKIGPDNTKDVIEITDITAGPAAGAPDDIEASLAAGAGAATAFATQQDILERAVFSDQNLRAFANASGFRAVARQIEVANTNAAAGVTANVQAGFVVADSLISRVNLAQTVIGVFESTLSSRQDFLESLTDSLELGVAALVEADLDEESSRLQSLQVQEQLAIQSLQIANQRPQNILSLFR
ncbi:flagellin [Hyphococcus sp.]|uniref:flagellin N-terminal helical domain-containing protein n=1 Tax=Hyphococcus sp. TaxID=2038636 RepID=UPI003D12EB12